jgi:Fe-S cluster assembly iron-binding protein IscA
LTFAQYGVILVVDEIILNEIIGDVEVDYKKGNLVEQGFIFKRLKYDHVCGCGESFTPIKDIPVDGKQKLGWRV